MFMFKALFNLIMLPFYIVIFAIKFAFIPLYILMLPFTLFSGGKKRTKRYRDDAFEDGLIWGMSWF